MSEHNECWCTSPLRCTDAVAPVTIGAPAAGVNASAGGRSGRGGGCRCECCGGAGHRYRHGGCEHGVELGGFHKGGEGY